LKVKDIPITATAATGFINMTIKLRHPETGEAAGTADCLVQFLTAEEATHVQSHRVFEFQRWQPIIEWGHSPQHYLPTDPGRWCSSDGQKFTTEREDAAPIIPDGWTITDLWHNLATDYDQEGWQYSTDFLSSYWFDSSDSGHCKSFYIYIH
jgi:hypothetical protein